MLAVHFLLTSTILLVVANIFIINDTSSVDTNKCQWQSLCLSLPVFAFFRLTLLVSVWLPVWFLLACLLVLFFICLYSFSAMFLSICLDAYQPNCCVFLSACLCTSMSLPSHLFSWSYPSVCLSVCQSACQSIYLPPMCLCPFVPLCPPVPVINQPNCHSMRETTQNSHCMDLVRIRRTYGITKQSSVPPTSLSRWVWPWRSDSSHCCQ